MGAMHFDQVTGQKVQHLTLIEQSQFIFFKAILSQYKGKRVDEILLRAMPQCA